MAKVGNLLLGKMAFLDFSACPCLGDSADSLKSISERVGEYATNKAAGYDSSSNNSDKGINSPWWSPGRWS